MPIVLVLTVAVCAAVAAASGQQVWAAVAGASLALAYWGLETLFARLGEREPFASAVAVGLVGMLVRMIVVLGALVALGIAAREAFPEAVVSFLAAFTVYVVMRLVANPIVPAGQGRT